MSSLPSSIPIQYRTFSSEEDALKLNEALSSVLQMFGEELDLADLDGITVGFDFADAIGSVDLGYESDKARTFSNSEVIAVGKMLSVRRDGAIKSHVVFNANLIWPLTDPEHKDFQYAAHLIAHELGHVAETRHRSLRFPDVLLRPHATDDWVVALLRESSVRMWEEYAACRMAANWGDWEDMRATYEETARMGVSDAITRSREAIKTYRLHGDVDRLLVETGKTLIEPALRCAYLLGHLDGASAEEELPTPPDAIWAGSLYEEFVPALSRDLRDLWDSRDSWEGMEVFDCISEHQLTLYELVGMKFSRKPSGGRLDIPFTAGTLPNGEADMLWLRQTGQI